MQFGIIGSGSWATALAKILTDNGNTIHWWVRNTDTIRYMEKRRHNPHYLNAVYFNETQLHLSDDIQTVVSHSEAVVIAVPSAVVESVLEKLPADAFKGKKIISAVKGILPSGNQLLNNYLADNFQVNLNDYFAVLGPCHAEQVAAETLSYLTFQGTGEGGASYFASYFKT